MQAELITVDLDSVPSFIHGDIVDLQSKDPRHVMSNMIVRAACRLMVEEGHLEVWVGMQREHMKGKFDKDSPVADAVEDFLKVMRVAKQVGDIVDPE